MFFTDEEKNAVNTVIEQCRGIDDVIVVDYMRQQPVLKAMEKQRKWQFRDLQDYIIDEIMK